MTASSKEEAKKIAKSLLEDKLIACANIIDKVDSLYWWEDQIQEDSEVSIIAKTHKSRFDEINTKVKSLHSYSCPCVIALPITDANPDYAKWLKGLTI